MPSMMEIYQSHSLEYDELVNHEDYQGNLRNYLLKAIDFSDKSVIEPGAGTGRVTRMYAEMARRVFVFDRSQHMLDKAAENLKNIKTDIDYRLLDNLGISQLDIKADVILEGWSFGHTVSENSTALENTVDKLISGCMDKLEKNGMMAIIETLGTNFKEPNAPSEYLSKFYSLLENKYGFCKQVIKTDYQFKSNEDARKITGYFFGEKFEKSLTFEQEGIVKEFTGVWIKSR